jgi:hypothetical protein
MVKGAQNDAHNAHIVRPYIHSASVAVMHFRVDRKMTMLTLQVPGLTSGDWNYVVLEDDTTTAVYHNPL